MLLLIVEDNPAMRCLIRRVTRYLAESIVECTDGSEAIAAYERHRFGESDWVLMDVEMAVMDGLTATRRLCAAHPEARIIIVTHHDDADVRAAAALAGARAFIPKENLLELRALLAAPDVAPRERCCSDTIN